MKRWLWLFLLIVPLILFAVFTNGMIKGGSDRDKIQTGQGGTEEPDDYVKGRVMHDKNKVYYIGEKNLLYQMDDSLGGKKILCDIPVGWPRIFYGMDGWIFYPVWEENEDGKSHSLIYRISMADGNKIPLLDGELLLIDPKSRRIYYETGKAGREGEDLKKIIMSGNLDGGDKKLVYEGEWGAWPLGTDDGGNFYIQTRDGLCAINSNGELKKIIEIPRGSLSSFSVHGQWLYFCCITFSGNADHIEGEMIRVKKDGAQLSSKTIHDNADYGIFKDQIYFCKTYERDYEDFYRMNFDFTGEACLLEGIGARIYPDSNNEWLYYVKENNIYRYHALTGEKQLILKRDDYFKPYTDRESRYGYIETEFQNFEAVDGWLYFTYHVLGYVPGNGGQAIPISRQFCRIKADGSGFTVLGSDEGEMVL